VTGLKIIHFQSINLKKVLNPFIFILLGFCANTYAQNPFIRHYTTLDGLPTNTIYQIYQDSHKFLWFTSEAGVIKFDGTNFKSYRKKDGLSSNDVVRIKEDPRGRLWFFNYNGSVNYIYKNKIYNGKNSPFLNSLMSKGFFFDFFTDKNQTLYFYNWQRELFSLDKNNSVSKEILLEKLNIKLPIVGTDYKRIKSLYVTKNSKDKWTIWTNVGIFIEDIPTKKIFYVDSDASCLKIFPAGHNSTYYIHMRDNNITKVTNRFFKEIIHYPGNERKIMNIMEDSDGYLWIAAYDEGVYCFKRNNKVLLHLNIKNALGLFQDHEKNIWVSSESNGIYLINHDMMTQKHYDRSNFDDCGVHLLSDFPGTGVWCTNTKSVFLLHNESFFRLSVPEELQPINLLHYLRNQNLFLGMKSTRACGYSEMKLVSNSKSIQYERKKKYPDLQAKKIFNDHTGVYTVLFEQDRILVTDAGLPTTTHGYKCVGERINNAFYDTGNQLIINARKNYLFKNDKLIPYPELSRFDGTVITDHLVLNDNVELYSIDGDSLYLLKNHKFYNLTEAFNTPIALPIEKILYDDTTLYVSTLKDIFVCHNPLNAISGNPVQLEPLNIGFNNINDILIHNDSLYIASDDGLTIISEASITKSNALPPIPYTQSVMVNDEEYNLSGEGIKLTGKNKIQLTFGCISFFSSSLFYSYLLEGAENKWTVGTGHEMKLMYQNLPRGHYIFKIRVRKSNSDWSKPLEIPIIIKPTLLENPIFWAIVCLVAAGIITLILVTIRARKMKKVEVDHQLIVMEQKALQSMMNPHFIFNSLGSIQNYLLTNKGTEAIIYLSNFARLIRQNLNAINTPMILLEEEIDRLNNYLNLEKQRLENKFDYHIEIDDSIEDDQVYIPSMMIQPFAENSIWHGIATLEEKGVISICFYANNEKSMRIIIEDNGIGMKKAQEYSVRGSHHQQLGMQIIRKRLDLLSKKYHTETKIAYSDCHTGLDNPGTRIEIIIPILNSTADF